MLSVETRRRYPNARIAVVTVWIADSDCWYTSYPDDGDDREHKRSHWSYLSTGQEYRVRISNADDDPIYYSDEPSLYGINLRDLISEAKDDAYADGFSHAIIALSEIDALEGARPKLIKLGSSTRRRNIIRRRRRHARHQAQRQQIQERRLVNADRLAYIMATQPTALAIRSFYRRWKRCTGYGPRKDPHERSHLGIAKANLIRSLLDTARSRSWTYGANLDLKTRNSYRQVIYVETPRGQVSFHVTPGSHGDLPQYTKPWSGLHNSEQILAALYLDEEICSEARRKETFGINDSRW